MRADPSPGFRAELTAALAAIEKEIEGLEDLAGAGFSRELAQAIDTALECRRTRRQLIADVITDMNGVLEKIELLVSHGYPKLPQTDISDVLAAELQRERDAIMAALAIFESQPRAVKITANFGDVVPKVISTE